MNIVERYRKRVLRFLGLFELARGIIVLDNYIRSAENDVEDLKLVLEISEKEIILPKTQNNLGLRLYEAFERVWAGSYALPKEVEFAINYVQRHQRILKSILGVEES